MDIQNTIGKDFKIFVNKANNADFIERLSKCNLPNAALIVNANLTDNVTTSLDMVVTDNVGDGKSVMPANTYTYNSEQMSVVDHELNSSFQTAFPLSYATVDKFAKDMYGMNGFADLCAYYHSNNTLPVNFTSTAMRFTYAGNDQGIRNHLLDNQLNPYECADNMIKIVFSLDLSSITVRRNDICFDTEGNILESYNYAADLTGLIDTGHFTWGIVTSTGVVEPSESMQNTLQRFLLNCIRNAFQLYCNDHVINKATDAHKTLSIEEFNKYFQRAFNVNPDVNNFAFSLQATCVDSVLNRNTALQYNVDISFHVAISPDVNTINNDERVFIHSAGTLENIPDDRKMSFYPRYRIASRQPYVTGATDITMDATQLNIEVRKDKNGKPIPMYARLLQLNSWLSTTANGTNSTNILKIDGTKLQCKLITLGDTKDDDWKTHTANDNGVPMPFDNTTNLIVTNDTNTNWPTQFKYSVKLALKQFINNEYQNSLNLLNNMIVRENTELSRWAKIVDVYNTNNFVDVGVGINTPIVSFIPKNDAENTLNKIVGFNMDIWDQNASESEKQKGMLKCAVGAESFYVKVYLQQYGTNDFVNVLSNYLSPDTKFDYNYNIQLLTNASDSAYVEHYPIKHLENPQGDIIFDDKVNAPFIKFDNITIDGLRGKSGNENDAFVYLPFKEGAIPVFAMMMRQKDNKHNSIIPAGDTAPIILFNIWNNDNSLYIEYTEGVSGNTDVYNMIYGKAPWVDNSGTEGKPEGSGQGGSGGSGQSGATYFISMMSYLNGVQQTEGVNYYVIPNDYNTNTIVSEINAGVYQPCTENPYAVYMTPVSIITLAAYMSLANDQQYIDIRTIQGITNSTSNNKETVNFELQLVPQTGQLDTTTVRLTFNNVELLIPSEIFRYQNANNEYTLYARYEDNDKDNIIISDKLNFAIPDEGTETVSYKLNDTHITVNNNSPFYIYLAIYENGEYVPVVRSNDTFSITSNNEWKNKQIIMIRKDLD